MALLIYWGNSLFFFFGVMTVSPTHRHNHSLSRRVDEACALNQPVVFEQLHSGKVRCRVLRVVVHDNMLNK